MLSEDFTQRRCRKLRISILMEKSWLSRLLKSFANVSQEARIINAYGPTEATVALSAVAVTDEMLANLKRLPTGYVPRKIHQLILSGWGCTKMVNRVKSSYQDQQFPKATWIILKRQLKPSSSLMVSCLPYWWCRNDDWMKVSFFTVRMDFQIKFMVSVLS